MRRLTALTLSATALLLAGCPTTSGPGYGAGPGYGPPGIAPGGPIATMTVGTFLCEDLTTITIPYAGDVATAMLNSGMEIKLSPQRVPVGFWFATPQFSFRGRGNEATWTVPQRAPVACRLKP